IADARIAMEYIAKGVIETNLTDAMINGDKVALSRFNNKIQSAVIDDSLVRVKIWNPNGKIVYSNESQLVDQKFPLDDDKKEMFDNNDTKAKAEVSDLSAPENQYEQQFTKLLEVYQLTNTTEGTPVIFEAYFKYSRVTEVGRTLWKQFAPIAIGALIALELIQIPIFITLARRLRAAQLQRERLLRHAIQASEAERRRIASDLHDGVVQELTGVSLSLAAASRGDSPDASRMGEAPPGRRGRVTSLLSLLA